MANKIFPAVNMTKAGHVIENFESAKVHEFLELAKRAYQPDPDPKDLKELQKWLDQYPQIWRLVFDLGQILETNFVMGLIPHPAAQLAIEMNVREIRRDLG